MTADIETLSHEELQREACHLRMQADKLMGEASMLDREAEAVEQRLERLGLKSFYVGSLERERTAFRLLDEAGVKVRAVR
jgi:3-deoxy-D-manno-octulosonate 8-phosphate phosphatase KdsC-like HAD superfamily phosphatase